MAELWTRDKPTGDGVLLSVGIGDVLDGDLESAVDVIKHALHADAEEDVGPLKCRYTTFGREAGARAELEAFLHECELPDHAIAEYLEGWDDARHPVAVIHWGTATIAGIGKAGMN